MLRLRLPRLLALILALAVGAQQAAAQKLSLGRDHGSKRVSVHLTLGGRAPKCEPARLWIAGRYEVRVERVWVDGCERRVWIPARYEVRRDSCGREVWVLVCGGEWRTVRDPGRYERREVRVWVPGHWREAPRY